MLEVLLLNAAPTALRVLLSEVTAHGCDIYVQDGKDVS